jgi:predicted N-acetyltransferase YhbS
MADVSVRPARPEDVAEIARIQIDTWRSAYASILPEPVIAALSVDTARAAWQEAVGAPPTPRHHVLVAQEQQSVVGFVALAPLDPQADEPQPPGTSPASTFTLGPLLVEPRWGRRGHGSRLLAAAVDHALGDGMSAAVAWVPEADTVTREFLVEAGWAPDGLARALDTGAGELREIRLHTSLEQP